MSLKSIGLGLVIGIIIGTIPTYLYITTNYNQKIDILIDQMGFKDQQNIALNTQIDNMQDNIDNLNTENENLQTEVSSKNNQVTTLNSEVTSLNEQVNSLNSQVNSLASEVTQLNQKIQVDASFRIYGNLTSFYDYIRDNYGLAGDDMGRSKQSQLKLGSQLAYHDLGYDVWPTQEASYFEAVGSHSYSEASGIIDYAITQSGINAQDDPATKIGKILDFINSRIDFSYEVDNIFRAPVETLSLRSGDCDDYSILAGALFERVGIDSAIGLFKNSEDEYHMMALVHMNELGSYAFYMFSDLTYIGLHTGRWIIIEPQYTINYQGDEAWMTQWQLETAVEIGV